MVANQHEERNHNLILIAELAFAFMVRMLLPFEREMSM